MSGGAELDSIPYLHIAIAAIGTKKKNYLEILRARGKEKKTMYLAHTSQRTQQRTVQHKLLLLSSRPR